MRKRARLALYAASFLCAAFLSGCKAQSRRVIVWTNKSEFAPYIEVFNKTHATKAVLVYKENPETSFPPDGQSAQPDIVISPWLLSGKTKKHFENIDYLFRRHHVNSSDFYEAFLNAGKISRKQYLLPVSFNLPAVMFARENAAQTENAYTMRLSELRRAGAAFNKRNKNGIYTQIGFAPQSNDRFLYTVAKMRGAAFEQTKTSALTWNQESLSSSIEFLKTWITNANTSVREESDFVYKYLSVADDKRVTSGRTLFAFTTSDRLFKLTPDQLEKVDFRWLTAEDAIPIEDSFTMMGIARGAKNHAGSAEFIAWFFKPETQRELLERRKSMNLDTAEFGVGGGFSSIKEVNERVLPVYYKTLLSNIPQGDSISIPEPKPSRWEKIKTAIVIPYIKDCLAAPDGKNVESIESRYAEWQKLKVNL
ncbi:MAG: extracellular solute-binding protein [Treponema sp.]